MHLITENGITQIIAENYRLTLPKDRPFVYVEDPSGCRLAELFVLSGVHPLHGRDDTLHTGEWQFYETPGAIRIWMEARSSVWQKKIYTFLCYPTRFTYQVEVEGVGQISEVVLFGGYYSGSLRWGSGFFYSGHHFSRCFNPDPNQEEINYFNPREGARIGLTGVPLPGKADWFFTPPPFSFGFETGCGWMGMSIEAPPGGNRFTEYGYHGQSSGFHLSLAYEGHTTVSERLALPAVGFDFSGNEYSLLEQHISAIRSLGYVPDIPARKTPAWWNEPIFCGWGQQCFLAEVEHGGGPSFSRQDLYEGWMGVLDRKGVTPGIVVLDDKWQETYGENRPDLKKWPDLRGFIDTRHARGQKVLLWLKAWDPECVPPGECITNACGDPLAVDPTSPAFEKRLRLSVQRMLSKDGYDADGLKIDFTARIPSGPSIYTYGDAWGLELMKLYLGIMYDEAKKTKPDALVMTHSPHPYLADVLDMIRLNDINKDKDVNRAMQMRARVARAACPSAIIDTDNWPITDRATWREYLRIQPDLGVPSLYYVTHIDTTQEPLNEEDYQLIRDVWKVHRDRTTSQQKETA